MKSPKQQILCVEDDEGTRFIMKILLELLGYGVMTAGTVTEGLSLAQSARPDLYLLDSHFPGGSGLELCEQLLRPQPAHPDHFLVGRG